MTDFNTDRPEAPEIVDRPTFQTALDAGSVPLREYMLGHTREADLALITRAETRGARSLPKVVAPTSPMPGLRVSITWVSALV